MDAPTFSYLDYFLFIFTLVGSALIGIYFGCIKKQHTANDYLLGGKQMSILPVSFSIISSGISGFTFLSVPADVYRYGISYGLNVPGLLVVGLASYYIFLPVFHKLQVTSSYEYFTFRFNYGVRAFASLLYAINMILLLPIVIYIPALALGQVTGMNTYLVTPIVSGICIFYTTLGGLRAVIWTDAFQFLIMMLSLIVVITVGVCCGGGLTAVFQNAYVGKRLDVSFDFDLLKRDTFWACLIGQCVHTLTAYPINQSPVQKLLSLPSFKAIKITIVLSIVGFAIITSLCVLSGLIMFTIYMDCDPFEANIIESYDQILPLFVMENVTYIPGMAGLFTSGIFSAGLSTLSAILNCLAATIYEDFISPFVSNSKSQKTISLYLKLIVVFLGILSTCLVYAVAKLGSLVPLTLSFAGITGGPLLGLFCAGMLFPTVNSKGALVGGITSLITMIWIVMTSQWYKVNGIITYPVLPISIDGCNETTNNTNKTIVNIINRGLDLESQQPNPVYRVSFYWYASMGFTVCLLVALVVSCCTKDKQPVNRNCISPLIHFLLKDTNNQKSGKCDDIMSSEKLNT